MKIDNKKWVYIPHQHLTNLIPRSEALRLV